jgi:predicted kinase
MSLTLLLTRGGPASGKSTAATAWVAADRTNRAMVSRDDLRERVYGLSMGPGDQVMDRAGEDEVTALEEAIVGHLLASGRSVAVHDTLLRDVYVDRWREIAAEAGAVVEILDLRGVPVEECIARDADRAAAGGRSVGADVIRRMDATGGRTWEA